ncbi:hypothetical protein R9C00_27360 [Flammeovirgaceae bacterium SG7u.111]|nr:hypothetical protein [Flammeovirgaceae bacterium SG7u.132]WPO35419.1 hypothetical protein R9C00_27360 [Flammeovirgaceae bacterium SG7u.111]
MYDFTANTGDTLVIKNEPFKSYWGGEYDYFIAKIKEKETKDINGQSLTYQIAELVPKEGGLRGWQYYEGGVDATLIQGIGSTFWLFGGEEFTPLYVKAHVGLRCFEYKGSVYKADTHSHEGYHWKLDCDYMKSGQ